LLEYTIFEENHILSENEFHVLIVRLIVDARPEEAIRLLSEHFGVVEPGMRVGTVKRHRKVLACYVERERRIYVSKRELFTNPFVILHEFYHHLRASNPQKNRQIEKRADSFAKRFIEDFRRGNQALTV
jgi:hypothetical protein